MYLYRLYTPKCCQLIPTQTALRVPQGLFRSLYHRIVTLQFPLYVVCCHLTCFIHAPFVLLLGIAEPLFASSACESHTAGAEQRKSMLPNARKRLCCEYTYIRYYIIYIYICDCVYNIYIMHMCVCACA